MAVLVDGPVLTVVLALAAGGTAALLVGPPRRLGAAVAAPRARGPAEGPSAASRGWLVRFRVLWCLLAGAAAATFLGGPAGPPAGLAAAVATWVVVDRSEPPAARRRREEVRAALPHVVGLLAAALRSGAAPGEAVRVVADALPGAAGDQLGGVAARLALGADPALVWEALATDPVLAPLGRALGAAHVTGVPVVRSVERLAEELATAARADVEDRARAVGVKAALPLGLCLLPAFVLLGIVPLAAGMLATLPW